MSTLRRLVHGRVDPADHRLLKHEADTRGISQTKCVGDIIREYFALRKEMLSVINSPEAPGEAHVGLVHSLVARMEGPLAVLLTARDDEVIERQRRIEWMIDRLAVMYLVHTPEIPKELRDGASATARRRYTNYRQAVDDRVASEKPGVVKGDSGERSGQTSSCDVPASP